MFIKNLLLVCFILVAGNISLAEELISKEAIVYYNEGVKAQKKTDFPAAEIAYQKALLVDPYNPGWTKFILNNRGVMLVRRGDLEKAEASFKAALEIDPDYKPAQMNLGLIYEIRKSRLEALEYWMKAFNLDKLKPADFVIEEEHQKNFKR